MKITAKTVTALALAGLIGGALSISAPLHAQDSTAGQEMHQSGASVKTAAGATGDSVKHAYHAAKDQLSDATLSTKVKAALLTSHLTKKYSIHVESDHGTVTLDGTVDSPATAAHAKRLVANVHGVTMVRNHLTWPVSTR